MQQRDLFEKIWSTKDNEFIKIITGIRRSGKSFLLKLLHERLKEEGCQVFYVNFEVIPYLRITTEDKFLDWLEGIELDTEKKVYFLFDEIQYVQGWERIINGIRATYDADIYLTGSNARMLSGNLATLIAGRYIQIEVYPLSFKEFLSFTNTDKENISEAWKRYRTEGGFPALPFVENDAIRTDILQGILDTVLLKDVSSNQGISNTDLLRRITNYLMDVIGNPVSTTNIENQIASEIGKKISKTTLSNILEALESAHVFYKAQRYDIRGKERLRSLAKYYVADVGLIGVALGRTDINRGSRLENIVYIELKRRGYQVFVGKYNEKEIDFVATKLNETMYVQVALELPEKSNREIDNLLHLPDNYEKILILDSVVDNENIDGVRVVNIVDWLLMYR